MPSTTPASNSPRRNRCFHAAADRFPALCPRARECRGRRRSRRRGRPAADRSARRCCAPCPRREACENTSSARARADSPASSCGRSSACSTAKRIWPSCVASRLADRALDRVQRRLRKRAAHAPDVVNRCRKIRLRSMLTTCPTRRRRRTRRRHRRIRHRRRNRRHSAAKATAAQPPRPRPTGVPPNSVKMKAITPATRPRTSDPP